MPSVIRSNAQLIDRARRTGSINHPHARRVKQLQRSVRRNNTKAKLDKQVASRRTAEEAQLFWLTTAYRRLTVDWVPQSNSNTNSNPYINSETGGLLPIVVEALVHIFIERNDEELRQLRNPVRGHPPRGQIKKLEILKESEEIQFQSRKGFRVPPFAVRDDIDLALQWLDTLLLLDEHDGGGGAQQGDGERPKLPHLPAVDVTRVSIKESAAKRISGGKPHPTDDFLRLVEQLRNQEGVGSHFQEYEEGGDGDGGVGSNDDDDDFSAAAAAASSDEAQKRRRRRRLFKVKKLSSRTQGAKKVVAQDVALVGTARRKQQMDSSRDKRRKDALAKARRESDANNDYANDEDEVI